MQSKNSVKKVALAGFIGTTIEWYDFFLYGTAAALVFNHLFFPKISPLAGVMAAYATYAVGFFARPLGGIIFGHFGDRIGRKSCLIITLSLMGMGSFLIGVLPTYHQIGLMAPILLTLLRFIQGLAIGGEWGGAVTLTAEHSHKLRRGFFSSWSQSGVPAGLVLATLAFVLFSSLPEKEFLVWGWRMPFLLSIILVIIGLFIRSDITESPVFKKEEKVSSAPIVEVLRYSKRSLFIGLGVRLADNASYYFFTVFVISYATLNLNLSKNFILYSILIASSIEIFTIPLFAAISDRVGRRPIFLFGAVVLILFIFPFFWLLHTKTIIGVLLSVIIGLSVCHAAMYGPQAAFFTELFETRFRYSGASLAYQLTAAFAGGLTPLIATALLAWSHSKVWPVCLYLIFLSLITIISLYYAKETARRDFF